VSQGFLRIINERYSDMPGNCHGHRVLTTPEGAERFEGFVSAAPASDVIRTYDHPAWVNVDGRLGIVFRGSDETVYHNRHYFSPWWATADDLVLSRGAGSRRVKAGAVITRLAAILTPGQSARQTAVATLVELAGRSGCVGLIGGGHLAAANFSPDVRPAGLRAARANFRKIPFFEGTTRISGRDVTYHLTLQPGQAVLRRALADIAVTGEIEVVAASTAVIVTNSGRSTATVSIGRKAARIAPGRMVRLR
jgi:hypothetical protein